MRGEDCYVLTMSRCPDVMSRASINIFLLRSNTKLPQTDELITFSAKKYQGQGSTIRQKIRIDVKAVLHVANANAEASYDRALFVFSSPSFIIC